MIDLLTGVPGSGKTLSAIEALSKMQARWEKHPEEARPVFVHGVRDLALPHAVVPLTTWSPKPGTTRECIDWDAIPDGAYILIDECQTLFPPRGTASEAPAHVAWLNTHRHRGMDITLVTQHPKLIDGSARALVGKHQHFRRLFGGQRAAVYEWDACSDSLSGMSTAITSYYPYPKKAFEFYKSAEVHTKQKFRLPRWLLIPFAGVALAVVTVPMAYKRISAMGSTEKARAAIIGSSASAASSPGALAPGSLAAASAPQQSASSVVVARPTYAGCIAMASRCMCVDVEGRTVPVVFEVCTANAWQSGDGVPYAMRSSAGSNRPFAGIPQDVSSGSHPYIGGTPTASPRRALSTQSVVTGSAVPKYAALD